jgi:hypothetical protein
MQLALVLPILALAAVLKWFFGGLAVIIGFSFILSPLRRSRQRKQRLAVFAAMGLHEMTAQEVFGEDTGRIARRIEDRPDSSLSQWVGKGSRPQDTVLFEFTRGVQEGTIGWIVAGFRLPTALADFEICHKMLLDKLGDRFIPSRKAAPAAVAPPIGVRQETKFGPLRLIKTKEAERAQLYEVAVQGNEDFAAKYKVWAADATMIPALLTTSFKAKLAAMDSSTLHILSGRGWVFVYHYGMRSAPPNKYPALLDEATDLVSRLNLGGIAGTPAGE